MLRRGGPRMLRSVEVVFWRLWRDGYELAECARSAGISERTGYGWLREGGGIEARLVIDPEVEVASVVGMRGLRVRSVALTLRERQLIAEHRGGGCGVREVARLLGRSPATISRELARGVRVSDGDYLGLGAAGVYDPHVSQLRAEDRRRRPKVRKLAAHPALGAQVTAFLSDQPDALPGPGAGSFWSPRQIAVLLRRRFPDRPEMWVSHETIYQSLYVQSRGGLRADLHRCLRTGRAARVPNARSKARRARAQTRIPDLVSISERPAEVADRAVPGHWEGDLILGKDNKSAVATLVERTTRFVMLLHLPGDRVKAHGAEAVRDAMLAKIPQLPSALWRSLTWDRGSEMGRHFEITDASGLAIYFCDPYSPWQRGSNENTNGLLRQYLPKGTDLSLKSEGQLDIIAAKLNARPRQTLDWHTPAERLNELLSKPFDHDGVASTT